MKKYAQIIDGKVHGVFEYEKLPQFSSNIEMVDITGLDIKIEVGWLYDGSLFMKPPQVAISINKLIANKIQELNSYINKQKADMEAQYSQISVGSFADKRTEALAWKIDNTASTPYVDMLCTKADGTVDATARDALLDAILIKVSQIAQLETYEDMTRTVIKNCTTQAELDAIVIGG